MPDQKTTSLAAWKKAKTHFVVLPSGVGVDIQLPDVPALIEAGHIPQHLIDAAIGTATGTTPDKPNEEQVKQQREFVRRLVALTVVNPKLSESDVDELPVEDREMLVEFASRQRDMDAAFNHIGGLHTSATFREVRGLPLLDPVLADV